MATQTPEETILAETAWNKRRLYALAQRIGPADREYDLTIPVTAPAFDEQIAEIPELDEDDVDRAVEQTREAADEWREMSVDERADVLTKFANLAADNRAELLDLVQLETGKSRAHALEETIDVSLNADYYADKGPEILATESRSSSIPIATSAEVQYDPKGVVGIISPWNYPLVLSFADAIPALLAGNGVVLKPDEKTPFTALRLAELLEEAGLPEGVVTVVTGDGPTIGSAVIERIDYLTFTGSSETGKLVAEQAGRNLIDCSLELSGKNPMIILDDADIEEAARGAIQGSFTNAGQLCLASERIYVHEDIYEEFLDEFVTQTEGLELGADFEFGADVGSMTDEAQLERTKSHVADAVEAGATVHAGGNTRSEIGPYFYEPTILTDVPATSLPACEETFGPLAVVESVSSAEKAIEKANDSDHGLNASVWSADRDRAKEVARDIESGTVCINDPFLVGWASYDAPMGGVKESGIGRRHGPEGLKRYTEPKTIATSAVGPLGPIPGVPDSVFAKGFSAISDLQRRLNQLRR